MTTPPELKPSIFDPKTQPSAYIKDTIGNIVFRLDINLTVLTERLKGAEGQLLGDLRRDIERCKLALSKLKENV